MIFTYDCIRIIRRVYPHSKYAAAAEDILFWLAWAMIIYALLYRCDYGAVRSYAIAGMALGICTYGLLISRPFVRGVSAALNRVLRCLMRPCRRFFGFIRSVMMRIRGRIRKIVNCLIKMLKKMIKPVTIKRQGKNELREVGDEDGRSEKTECQKRKKRKT